MPSVCYIQVLSCRKDQDVNQSFWLLTAKLTGNLALETAHSVTDTSESPADHPQHQHQCVRSLLDYITAHSVWIQGWYSQKQYYWFSTQFSILWKGIHSLTLRRWRLILFRKNRSRNAFFLRLPKVGSTCCLWAPKQNVRTAWYRRFASRLIHMWFTHDRHVSRVNWLVRGKHVTYSRFRRATNIGQLGAVTH